MTFKTYARCAQRMSPRDRPQSSGAKSMGGTPGEKGAVFPDVRAVSSGAPPPSLGGVFLGVVAGGRGGDLCR